MKNNKSISKASSDALAARVVIYRALGYDKKNALLCMQELARRRQEGEEFDYESFIDEKLKAFPKSKKMKLFSILKTIQQYKG